MRFGLQNDSLHHFEVFGGYIIFVDHHMLDVYNEETLESNTITKDYLRSFDTLEYFPASFLSFRLQSIKYSRSDQQIRKRAHDQRKCAYVLFLHHGRTPRPPLVVLGEPQLDCFSLMTGGKFQILIGWGSTEAFYNIVILFTLVVQIFIIYKIGDHIVDLMNNLALMRLKRWDLTIKYSVFGKYLWWQSRLYM